MYKSEIRNSQLKKLEDKVDKLNYEKYLSKINIIKCRAFEEQVIRFDFPVTALIGPNDGGKTTILGACALLYNSIAPRQFFTRNKQLDEEMRNWSISYDAIDRTKSKMDIVKRTASFSKEKWYRNALKRETLFFGVSRTLPAVERRDLSKFTNKNVVFKKNEIQALGTEVAAHITKVLGKDVSAYTVIKPDRYGNITLLSGKTKEGRMYSEFHFGAGESSIIKMILNIENVAPQSLVLIEEIENGLHPIATERLVEYLLDVADRKNIQVIFTTHSQYAINPLPAKAVWAAIDGSAIQGKLDIRSLRSITGEINSELVIYVEDEFAKKWVYAMLRADESIALDAIEVYAMGGDGTAVTANKYHHSDPSTSVNSICIIDGDSRQMEDVEEHVFRLPGEAPELHVFDEIVDKLDECSAILSVRCMRGYKDASEVKETILEVSRTNRDHHLIFGQIGEKIGFVDENIIEDAFLTTWSEKFEDECKDLITRIKQYLPIV